MISVGVILWAGLGVKHPSRINFRIGWSSFNWRSFAILEYMRINRTCRAYISSNLRSFVAKMPFAYTFFFSFNYFPSTSTTVSHFSFTQTGTPVRSSINIQPSYQISTADFASGLGSNAWSTMLYVMHGDIINGKNSSVAIISAEYDFWMRCIMNSGGMYSGVIYDVRIEYFLLRWKLLP